jgi:hypothetical protein
LIYIYFFVPAASSIRHKACTGAVWRRAAAGFSQSYPQKMCMTAAGHRALGAPRDAVLRWA